VLAVAGQANDPFDPAVNHGYYAVIGVAAATGADCVDFSPHPDIV
jgi:hypothetical protein